MKLSCFGVCGFIALLFYSFNAETAAPVGATVSGTTLQVFELNNRKGLKDMQGKILIPAKYDEIGWSNEASDPVESVIGYKFNGFWGITTLADEQVTKPVYRDLYPLPNGQIKASRTDPSEHFLYYGVLDIKGSAVVGFQYYDLQPSGTNYIAALYKSQSVSYGLISGEERTLIAFEYRRIGPLGNGLYSAVNALEKATVYSSAGAKLANEGFDSLSRLNNDLLVVSKEGKLGLMKNDGSYLLEPFYKAIEPVNDSIFNLTTYPSWQLVDKKNSTLRTFYFDKMESIGPGVYRAVTYQGDALINLSGVQLSNKSNWSITYTDENFVISKEDGKFRVYNKSGQPFLDQAYDSLHFDGKNFYTAIKKGSKTQWEVINSYGRKVTRFPYDELKPESSKMIPARRDKYWGFLDFNGALVIDHKFEKAHTFTEGLAAVEYLGRWGVIDLNGNWVFNPKYDYCEILNDKVVLTRSGSSTDLSTHENEWIYSGNHSISSKKGWLLESTSYGSYGLLFSNGKKVTSPEFDEIVFADNDSTVFLRQGDYWWVMDGNGKPICTPQSEYQKVSPVSESFFMVMKDGKTGFVDLNNKLRIANRYDDAYSFNEGLAAIKLREHWGFIDKIERIAVQPTYDQVEPFNKGLSIVVRSGKWGLIDKAGKEVVELDFDAVTNAGNGTYMLRQGDQHGFFYAATSYMMLPRFNSLAALPNGYFIAGKRGLKGLINQSGVDVIPSVYQEIIFDPYKELYLCMLPGITETFSIK